MSSGDPRLQSGRSIKGYPLLRNEIPRSRRDGGTRDDNPIHIPTPDAGPLSVGQVVDLTCRLAALIRHHSPQEAAAWLPTST